MSNIITRCIILEGPLIHRESSFIFLLVVMIRLAKLANNAKMKDINYYKISCKL